jgi:hypothetical protein
MHKLIFENKLSVFEPKVSKLSLVKKWIQLNDGLVSFANVMGLLV